MKKQLIVLLLLMVTATSCKDFLSLSPEYQISDQTFFKNQNDFETALTGVYSTFRGLFSGSAVLYMTELATDNTEIQWSSPSTDEMQMDQNAVTSTNGFVRSVWNSCLYTISQSNGIINRIDAATFDQTVKDRIKGEAKFLRAYSYFYLVRSVRQCPDCDPNLQQPGTGGVGRHGPEAQRRSLQNDFGGFGRSGNAVARYPQHRQNQSLAPDGESPIGQGAPYPKELRFGRHETERSD
jgi:hypothetical protein